MSNSVNKIFSRIVHERIKDLLPQLISLEQEGFVQGRSVVENVLIVQEIVTEIKKRGKPPNMVMKLEIMKAYNRVEWLFLTKVLRKLWLLEMLVDMVFRLLENN